MALQRISAPETPEVRSRRLAAEVRKNAATATTVPSLKAELTKLAEVVEILLNKQ